jgi:hypothetical protein
MVPAAATLRVEALKIKVLSMTLLNSIIEI